MAACRHRSTARAVTAKAVALVAGTALMMGLAACTSEPASGPDSSLSPSSDGSSAPGSTAGSPTDATAPDAGTPTDAPEGSSGPAAPSGDAPTTGAEPPPTGEQSSAPPTTILEGAPVTRAPAIDLTATGDLGGSVTARITQIGPIESTADLPGEVAGPAIALTIEIANDSTGPISLDGVTVTMTDSSGAAATATTGNSAQPFAGMSVEGGKAQGTYVFVVPSDARNPITVTLGYSPSSPTLVFSGEVAAG